jgi:hypothetical protein
MNGKITLVSAPDDVLEDGIRILTYGLTSDQSFLLSSVLKDLEDVTLVCYIANGLESEQWTLDKKQKSSIIILNAEYENQTMVGYLAAQQSSYYFGNLLSIMYVNKNKIESKEQLKQIMEDTKAKYAKLQ